MIFNHDQEITIEEGVNFIKNSSEQVFQIDGEAGTGKSVVLNEIVRRSNIKFDRVMPMAYTGQAAIVMRSKGLINARTCHSSLFEFKEVQSFDKYNKPIISKQFNSIISEYKFVPIEQIYGIDLFIIDEGWMVPKWLKSIIEKHGIKIIVAGDMGQLPPVGDEPAYFVDGKIHHLTELMRQAKESPLIYLAHRARNGLPIQTGLYGNSVLVIYEDELTDEMISASNVILCGKNNTKNIMNNKIRNDILGIYRDIPAYGERVICRKNSWSTMLNGISLANGLCGTVTSFPDVSSFDGKTFRIDFMPDLLNESFQNIVCDYNYFNGDEVTRSKIKNDKYAIGEKFEPAYALTTYVAQGSEHINGIYIEEYLNKAIQNNLNYTGITRFREGMIYVKKKRRFF